MECCDEVFFFFPLFFLVSCFYKTELNAVWCVCFSLWFWPVSVNLWMTSSVATEGWENEWLCKWDLYVEWCGCLWNEFLLDNICLMFSKIFYMACEKSAPIKLNLNIRVFFFILDLPQVIWTRGGKKIWKLTEFTHLGAWKMAGCRLHLNPRWKVRLGTEEDGGVSGSPLQH